MRLHVMCEACLCHGVVMPAGDWCGCGALNMSWLRSPLHAPTVVLNLAAGGCLGSGHQLN